MSSKHNNHTSSAQSDELEGASQPEPNQRIWQVVAMIPEGRVATYGQIAALAGMPRHARLVGRTLALLPKGSKLPWHRVINAAGRISLRGSDSHMTQRHRLEREGIEFVGERVVLKQYRWQP